LRTAGTTADGPELYASPNHFDRVSYAQLLKLGQEYAKDDFEGRGILSYSGEIDRSIIREQQREHGGSSSGHGEVIQLNDQSNKADEPRGSKDGPPSYAEWEEDHEDSKSPGIGGGLKRRIGNLIKKDK